MEARLRYVAETGSTNDDVMAMILEHAPHGTALYAGVQRGGRGRQGRAWTSPAGENLALSVAVVGEHWQPQLRLIPLAVGVAMAELLEAQCGIQMGLKWPNDLFANDRKLGGILCEGVNIGARFAGAVVGVGVNLNLRRESLPEELRDRASSVLEESRLELDLHDFAMAAHRAILHELDRLHTEGRQTLLDRFRARDVTKGRTVEVLSTGRYGLAEGIDRDGALLVRFGDGSVQAVHSGEVHLHRSRDQAPR